MPIWEIEDPKTKQVYEIDAPSMPSGAQLEGVLRQMERQMTEPARTPGRPRGLATIGEMAGDSYGPDGYGAGYGEELGGGDVAKGIAKGAANTVVGLGEMVHRVPGVSRVVDTLYGDAGSSRGLSDLIVHRPGLSERAFTTARAAVQPTNAAQQVGFTAEQIGEFFTPVGAAGKVKAAVEVGKAAVLTGAQGGTKGDVGLSAGLSAVVPGAGAVRKAAAVIGSKAEPLVRAAIKPTVSAMKQVAGASVTGIDAQAAKLVRFILENKVTTAEKARTIVTQAEQELQRLLKVKNAPTDAPQRAVRYLDALERQAAKQGLPASDVAAIRNAAAEVLETGLGEDVITMVSKPHPTLVGPNGTPIIVKVPETSRALRTDVMADEALERARATSKWDTRKAYGEQKGAQLEASKAVERGLRDSMKAAVPETKPVLQRQGQAIQTAKMLDRAEFRAKNRDAVSLPAHVVAAGEIARGGVPVLAFAANWLRNNQLKAGVWANTLSKAIEKGNAPLAADILKRLGVGSASQAMRTATAP